MQKPCPCDKCLVKSALARAVRIHSDTRFMSPNGSIDAKQMLQMIEENHPWVVDFLEDVVATAVRILHLRGKKNGEKEDGQQPV